MVFGTTNETYTAPGIDSSLSRSRQFGPLGVVTSDQYGNLASDNGSLYKQIATVKAGTAIAMSLADPYLQGDQRFGIKVNAGGFDGAAGLGLSAAGVLARHSFSDTDSLTLSGAAGWGTASVQGYNESTFGGRASLQLAW